MRKLMYNVTCGDREFTTSKYAEATATGCRITGTYLVDVDETTDEQKEYFKQQIKKRKEFLAKRKNEKGNH